MKTFIIDDHALFRDGLSALLKSHNISVETANNARIGIEALKTTQVDIILLDLRMPDMHGIDALKAIKANNITAPVVILTTSSDEKDLVDCLKYGAQAYLLKDMEPEHLVEALNDILKGSIVVAQAMTHTLANLLKGELSTKKLNSFERLTPKEKEVLCLISDGLSNKVIAKALNITDGTVKLHVKSLLKKLNLSSRVEAAVMATKQALCDES
jgi:two-component system nitrate/nitrite response regulator NarL